MHWSPICRKYTKQRRIYISVSVGQNCAITIPLDNFVRKDEIFVSLHFRRNQQDRHAFHKIVDPRNISRITLILNLWSGPDFARLSGNFMPAITRQNAESRIHAPDWPTIPRGYRDHDREHNSSNGRQSWTIWILDTQICWRVRMAAFFSESLLIGHPLLISLCWAGKEVSNYGCMPCHASAWSKSAYSGLTRDVISLSWLGWLFLLAAWDAACRWLACLLHLILEWCGGLAHVYLLPFLLIPNHSYLNVPSLSNSGPFSKQLPSSISRWLNGSSNSCNLHVYP